MIKLLTNHIQYLAVKPFISSDVNKLIKGKSVVLVGPADTTTGKGLGSWIEGHDVVVRVNRGVYLLENPGSEVDIGKRTDILFHNLTDRHGTFDIDYHERANVGCLMTYARCWPWIRGNIKIAKFAYANWSYCRQRLTLVGPQAYKDVMAYLRGTKPTAGFMALWVLLHAGCTHVSMTGFSFFRSEYNAGYYANNLSVDDQLKRFDRQKSHSPQSEAEAFKRLAKAHTDRLRLDAFLAELASEDEAPSA